MNIFILDTNPAIAAQLHLDKHIIKMPLETAQMLSTISGGPYKPTHVNRPCTRWAAASSGNYRWLVALGLELCREYTYRYGRTHKCQAVIEQLREPPACVPFGDMTAFAQVMPDACRGAVRIFGGALGSLAMNRNIKSAPHSLTYGQRRKTNADEFSRHGQLNKDG